MSAVFCLMGPTAAGKSQLALELAQALPLEIVSVDSAMVYRGMDIGTAKPSTAELAMAPHHLIDICDPRESYSAGAFCRDAQAAIATIFAKGKIPLLVGGTMLYFRVLQQGIAALPAANPQIRQQLAEQGIQVGWPSLHARLSEIDAESAARISPHDAQRIQRALEVYAVSGKSLSEYYRIAAQQILPYSFVNLTLWPENRALLADRIVLRFHNMLAQGFMEEVKQLFERGDLQAELPAMRAVGYKQAWQYLAGKLSYTAMQEQATIATRQLAKRQLTWLRTWPHSSRFVVDRPQLITEIYDYISRYIFENQR